MSDPRTIQLLPRWIILPQGEASEAVAFFSGAALAMLDLVVRDPGGTGPGALLRDRLALDAAVSCLKLEGRAATAADIRDAVCLARAGDAVGPVGDMFVAWRKLARINLTMRGWKDRVGQVLPSAVAGEGLSQLGVLSGPPGAQASDILAGMLRQCPGEEAAALMLADLALARAVGWDRPLPVFAAHLARKDVRAMSAGDRHAVRSVHRAMIAACDAAIRLAADLDNRAAKVRTIAPRLRAKGADAAVALFLTQDAVSPSGMLSPMIQGTNIPMTDRAARRLCERLVELGVVRELTGRSTFRLYGV